MIIVEPVTVQDAVAAVALHDRWIELQTACSVLSNLACEGGGRLYDSAKEIQKCAEAFGSDKTTPQAEVRRELAALRHATLRTRWKKDLIAIESALAAATAQVEELKAYAKLSHVLSKCSE